MGKWNYFLQQLRNEKGYTQEETANRLNVSRSAVSLWETGRREPDIDTLQKLAALYAVSLDELVYGVQSEQRVQKERSRRAYLRLSLALAVFACTIFFRTICLYLTKGNSDSFPKVYFFYDRLTEIPLYFVVPFLFLCIIACLPHFTIRSEKLQQFCLKAGLAMLVYIVVAWIMYLQYHSADIIQIDLAFRYYKLYLPINAIFLFIGLFRESPSPKKTSTPLLQRCYKLLVSGVFWLACLCAFDQFALFCVTANHPVVASWYVPSKMQPGSKIEFIDRKHYVILEGAPKDADDPTPNWDLSWGYPLPKTGMLVTYSSDGFIAHILDPVTGRR